MSGARRAAGVCLAAALLLAGLEMLVRTAGVGPPPPQRTGYVADPILPFRPRPHAAGVTELTRDGTRYAFRHNSRGFRGAEWPAAKSPGTWRIVGLGDSFTYGAGAELEETYLARLAQHLARRPGCTVPLEVINLGVSRYFPAAERLLLEAEGLRLAPDVVVVGVTPNDVIDTYLGLDAVTVHESGHLVPRAAQALGPLAVTLALHSQLARTTLALALAPQGARGRAAPSDALYEPGGFYEPDWQAMEADLAGLAALARRHGAHVVVVGIPQADFASPYVDAFDRRLAAWGTREGIRYVSVLAALRRAAARAPMYWPHDGHCRPAGYAVIAERIAAVLARDHLVPCTPPRD